MIAPLFGSITRPLLSPLVSGLRDELFGAFTPRSLFNDGSIGVLYDNNDLTSFYLDAAGTTPATVNGLVGLQLDKSQGLVLGAELSAYANGFSNTTGIIGQGATVAISSSSLLITATSIDGSDRAEIPISGLTVGKHYKVVITARRGTQGDKQVIRASTALDISDWAVPSQTATTQTWITTATAASGIIRAYVANLAGAIGDQLYVDSISVRELPGNHRFQTTTGSKPVLRGTPTGGSIITNGDFSSDTIWSKGAGWSIGSGVATKVAGSPTSLLQSVSLTAGKVYRFTYTVTVTAGGVQPIFSGGTSAFGTLRSASGTFVDYITANSGNNQVGLTTNATFAGTVDNIEIVDVSAGSVTAPYGLQYDGVDDFLQTASVNFSATDKMFVCAGVRKLSDSAQGILVEHTASVAANNGSFYLAAPNSAAANFAFASKGTVSATDIETGVSAPATRVLSGIGNISGDSSLLRINGVDGTAVTTDQGTGNYANAVLYFGRRGGTTLPFNGLDFGFVIVGKTLTAAQIASTERWMAQRTGVSI